MSAILESRPNTIESEIAAYETMQGELEAKFLDKWVVVNGGKLAGVFEAFEEAAAHAVAQFGRGPYLIRQVGQKPTVLPASVVYSQVRHGR